MADFFRNGLDGRWGMGMGKTIVFRIGNIVISAILHILNNIFVLLFKMSNQTCPGMGMGYGSSLPMSGYYHQMGPMSQVN